MTKRNLAATVLLTVALGVTLSACSSTSDEGTPAPTGSSAIAVDPAETSSASAQEVADQIVGMSASDAQSVVEGAGYTWRVGEIDGQPQPVTMDLREDRITVTISDDIVTAAVVG